MSVFAAKSPCCGAPIETRTDGPGGIGRTFEFCSKCDMAIPTSMARAPAPPKADPSLPAPAPPRRVPPAAPPTSEPAMPRKSPSYAPRQCAYPPCSKTYNPTGAKQQYCTPAHKDADRSGEAPPPEKKRPRVNTGFKAEPPRAGKNMYQPTIDALQEELDAIEIRRTDIGAVIEQLTKLGAA